MARRGRYSNYIRPFSYILDLIVLIFFAFQSELIKEMSTIFYLYVIIMWVLLSFYTKFYEVYRYTKFVKISLLSINQAVIFTLIVFAFFGFYNELETEPSFIFIYLGKSFFIIFLFKITLHFFLKKYRQNLGGNFRRTIIIGSSHLSSQLKSFFDNNSEYGYKCQKVFKSSYDLDHIQLFVIENNIDEIYCSMDAFENQDLDSLVNFADNNLKVLKFLPDNKNIFFRKLNFEYYSYLPIISLRKIPIDSAVNQLFKRVFDIVLSSIVIILILSWLTPLMAILIKLESKGAVFFKQKRNGLNYEEFYCYKFRSMIPNPEADLHQVKKNDKRVTKVGKFMRKTSLDELPQFYNVFKGDMSVVGPRPHMVSHTHMYAENVDKFMVRHFVKPGITGLAQVSGYRGEIETDHDIINRVKYDIFYLENWSILLDLKIVLQTVTNAIKGEKKAY